MSIPEVDSRNRLLAFLEKNLKRLASLGNLIVKGNLTIDSSTTGTALNVTLGDSGGTAPSAYDNVVFESDGDFGMTIMHPSAQGASIVFGTEADNTSFLLGHYPAINATLMGPGTSGMSFKLYSGNFVQAMELDASQRVTTPSQPGFSARLTSDQAIATNTWTTVVFDAEDFDTGGDYAVGTGEFTAPVSGKYLFAGSCRMDAIANNATAYPWARFYNNTTGKEYRHSLYDVSNRDRAYWSLGGAIVMDLTAGHVVTYDVFNRSDATTLEVGTNPGTIEYNWFTGYLLG
jgi:hypothetical protein